MNKDKAVLLATALRSGEFPQAQEKLRNKKGFCCLGVACELYRREVGGEWDGKMSYGFSFDGEANYLPHAVKEWLGVGSADPGASGDKLSFLNDSGASFAQIADFIEANAEEIL